MINLQVPINSLGYGIVGYNIWKELRKLKDVTLWPIGGQVHLPNEQAHKLTEEIQQDILKQKGYSSIFPTLKVWHENQLAEHVGRGSLFAYPFFEINKFDMQRKTHLESVDYLFVSSEWAKDIVLDQTSLMSNDIIVAPCGVDTSIFKPLGQSMLPECVFFNCGKWEIRKGHDVLMKAFTDAFPDGSERVELWMMTQNPFLNDDEKNYWHSLMRADLRIRHVPRVTYQEELNKIMNKAFCGVFPSKAEGWNLELLEMMACGKHVIATNYSAHTEFCNSNNSFLIDIVEEENAFDGKWFKGDCGTWASLEGSAYDQLVEHMRQVYRMWQSNKGIVNSGGVETAQKFSWKNTVKIIEENIHEQ